MAARLFQMFLTNEIMFVKSDVFGIKTKVQQREQKVQLPQIVVVVV